MWVWHDLITEAKGGEGGAESATFEIRGEREIIVARGELGPGLPPRDALGGNGGSRIMELNGPTEVF